MTKQDLVIKIGLMLDGAEGFIFASKLCNKAVDTKEIRFDKIMSAQIMNISFACEILLKALLLGLNIVFKKKHKLNELFRLLPKELQERINEKIYLRYGTTTSGCWVSLIDINSNVFLDWRYSFEIEKLPLNCDYSFLAIFSDILKNEVEKLLK